jgi:hypothetical protein
MANAGASNIPSYINADGSIPSALAGGYYVHRVVPESDDSNNVIGPGNSGYGSKIPMDFFDGNHIKDGHHI